MLELFLQASTFALVYCSQIWMSLLRKNSMKQQTLKNLNNCTTLDILLTYLVAYMSSLIDLKRSCSRQVKP